MNVINRAAIRKAQRKHPECREWLESWWTIARKATWRGLRNVRVSYPAADQVGGCLVFDAPEARRLIVGIYYARRTGGGTVYVRHLLTHNEYDRGGWRKDCQHQP